MALLWSKSEAQPVLHKIASLTARATPQCQEGVVVIDDFRQVREPPVMIEPELGPAKNREVVGSTRPVHVFPTRLADFQGALPPRGPARRDRKLVNLPKQVSAPPRYPPDQWPTTRRRGTPVLQSASARREAQPPHRTGLQRPMLRNPRVLGYGPARSSGDIPGWRLRARNSQ
jgi:hypothetical protein